MSACTGDVVDVVQYLLEQNPSLLNMQSQVSALHNDVFALGEGGEGDFNGFAKFLSH